MKKLAFIFILFPLLLYAYTHVSDYESEEPTLPAGEMERIAEENRAEGLPVADSGVYFIHAAELNADGMERREQYLKERTIMLEKGYIESNSTDAKQLLKMTPPKSDIEDGLYSNLSDIKLGFPYSGIPFILKTDHIGYAEYGGWNKGYTGIVEFFKVNELGTCNYSD